MTLQRIDFHNKPYIDPYEYWCYDCRSMNWSCVDLEGKCGSCGSTNIITGKPMELDLETLRNSK